MAGRIDFVLRGAGVTVVAGVLATGAYVVGGGGGDPLTANLWVDTTTSGNTCVDHGSLTAYATNDACNSFDAAWDAAEAGDIIRVKAGSYGSQVITGDKASETRIIGEDQATVTVTDGEALGDHMTLENMTINSGATHGWTWRNGSASVQADNITFRDVVMRGSYIGLEHFDGNNFTWDGGSLGASGDTPGERCNVGTSDIQPIQINEGTGHHFNDLTVWPQAGKDSCDVDGFHEEDMRIESTNTVIENVVFKDGSAVNRNGGSGKIFVSGSSVQNLVIRNVIFGPVATDSNAATQDNATGCTVTIAYSTYTTEGDGMDQCSITNIQNIGPGATGVNSSTGLLSAAAVSAIDQAETGSGADYCVNALGSRDVLGNVRPTGSKCDKGAHEYQP